MRGKKRTKSFRPVKRPGALTRKAKRAGESVSKFARQHYHDSGLTGQEARFAVIQKKWRKGGARKKKTRKSHRAR